MDGIGEAELVQSWNEKSAWNDKRRINAAKKKLALKAGWPKPVSFTTVPNHWDYLEKIPGSFATSPIPADCPVHVFEAACYDLLPSLLDAGLEGQHLAFGYGPKWYSTGATAHLAMTEIIQRFNYQMPLYSGVIELRRLQTSEALAYFAWKD